MLFIMYITWSNIIDKAAKDSEKSYIIFLCSNSEDNNKFLRNKDTN